MFIKVSLFVRSSRNGNKVLNNISIEEALQKGIEAHKAGKAQEADRYYTAILKADPKHSDANHNMGVLAVGVGKVEEALPFFKTALEVNPTIAQYWISYIDALIRLDRIEDAQGVFDQAKSKGLESESLAIIEEKLGGLEKSSPTNDTNAEDPPKDQFKSLINLYSKGQFQEALTNALQLLPKYPKSALPVPPRLS